MEAYIILVVSAIIMISIRLSKPGTTKKIYLIIAAIGVTFSILALVLTKFVGIK